MFRIKGIQEVVDHLEQRLWDILGILQLLVAEGRSVSWVAPSRAQELSGLSPPFNKPCPDIVHELIQLTTHAF